MARRLVFGRSQLNRDNSEPARPYNHYGRSADDALRAAIKLAADVCADRPLPHHYAEAKRLGAAYRGPWLGLYVDPRCEEVVNAAEGLYWRRERG